MQLMLTKEVIDYSIVAFTNGAATKYTWITLGEKCAVLALQGRLTKRYIIQEDGNWVLYVAGKRAITKENRGLIERSAIALIDAEYENEKEFRKIQNKEMATVTITQLKKRMFAKTNAVYFIAYEKECIGFYAKVKAFYDTLQIEQIGDVIVFESSMNNHVCMNTKNDLFPVKWPKTKTEQKRMMTKW